MGCVTCKLGLETLCVFLEENHKSSALAGWMLIASAANLLLHSTSLIWCKYCPSGSLVWKSCYVVSSLLLHVRSTASEAAQGDNQLSSHDAL